MKKEFIPLGIDPNVLFTDILQFNFYRRRKIKIIAKGLQFNVWIVGIDFGRGCVKLVATGSPRRLRKKKAKVRK